MTITNALTVCYSAAEDEEFKKLYRRESMHASLDRMLVNVCSHPDLFL